MCPWWSELLQPFMPDNFPQLARALCSGIQCSCHPREKKKCKINSIRRSIQQDEVKSLSQRWSFIYQMTLSSSFTVSTEYRSPPKLQNALMKKQYITFTRSSYFQKAWNLTDLSLYSVCLIQVQFQNNYSLFLHWFLQSVATTVKLEWLQASKDKMKCM